MNSFGTLKYDAAPFVEVGQEVQTGHAIVLGADSDGVVHYKDRGAPDIPVFNFFRNFLVVHDIVLYTERLRLMLEKGKFPVSMNGFDTGHPCTLRSECASPNVCSSRRCGVPSLDFERGADFEYGPLLPINDTVLASDVPTAAPSSTNSSEISSFDG